MTRNRGFTLIEICFVVAIILILAAIAIPHLLQARMAANEASAVSSLRVIQYAETAYDILYSKYAPSLASLGGARPCVGSSTSACILDNSLASASPGTGSKAGYGFLATPLSIGGGVDNSFVAAASPLAAHSTGNHDFCVTDSGVLRSSMANLGDQPITTSGQCSAFSPIESPAVGSGEGTGEGGGSGGGEGGGGEGGGEGGDGGGGPDGGGNDSH